MEPLGVHETVVYASDLAAAEGFYAGVLGLRAMAWGDSPTGRGFWLASGAVLLVFDPEVAARPGRGVPAHGAVGAGHVAFAIREESYDEWLGLLVARGVAIEQEIDWPGGARSIYFRDPAGNSVELMAGDCWARVEVEDG